MSKARIRLGVKFLLLVGMACFIFPFATVSCSAVHYEFNGLELMTAFTLKEDINSSGEQLYPNFLLMGAFILAGFATFLGWKAIADREEGSRGAVVCSILGTLCLLLFPFTFQVYYNLDELITVEFQWGFYASLLAYVGGTVCILADFQGVGSRQESFSKGATHKSPPGVEATMLGSPALPQTTFSKIKVALQITQNGTSQIMPSIPLPCYLGSDQNLCQIVLTDTKASSIHAQIYIENDSVYLQDMGSEYGTVLNGIQLSGPGEILSGDEALIDSIRIRFVVGT